MSVRDGSKKKGNTTMGHSPVIRKLQPLANPHDRQVELVETQWTRFVAAATNPDLLAVVAFCVIGFLLAFNLMLRFPDLGAVIEQYNQF
jgi:hypothetical protein